MSSASPALRVLSGRKAPPGREVTMALPALLARRVRKARRVLRVLLDRRVTTVSQEKTELTAFPDLREPMERLVLMGLLGLPERMDPPAPLDLPDPQDLPGLLARTELLALPVLPDPKAIPVRLW